MGILDGFYDQRRDAFLQRSEIDVHFEILALVTLELRDILENGLLSVLADIGKNGEGCRFGLFGERRARVESLYTLIACLDDSYHFSKLRHLSFSPRTHFTSHSAASSSPT